MATGGPEDESPLVDEHIFEDESTQALRDLTNIGLPSEFASPSSSLEPQDTSAKGEPSKSNPGAKSKPAVKQGLENTNPKDRSHKDKTPRSGKQRSSKEMTPVNTNQIKDSSIQRSRSLARPNIEKPKDISVEGVRRTQSASVKDIVTVDRVREIQLQMDRLKKDMGKMKAENMALKEQKGEKRKPEISPPKAKRKIIVPEEPEEFEDDTIEYDDEDDAGFDWLDQEQPALVRKEETRSGRQFRDELPIKNWNLEKGKDTSKRIQNVLSDNPLRDHGAYNKRQSSGSDPAANDIIMGINPIRDLDGRLVPSKTPAVCTLTVSGMHQRRLRESAEVTNLDTQNKDDRKFLQMALQELVTMKGFVEDSVRRLFMMRGPERVQSSVHSVLDDLLSAQESLFRLQKNLKIVYSPGMTYSGAISYANQSDRREDQDATDRKILENVMKEVKAREDEQKQANRWSNNYQRGGNNNRGGRSGRRSGGAGRGRYNNYNNYNNSNSYNNGPPKICYYCNGENHSAATCRKRKQDEEHKSSK